MQTPFRLGFERRVDAAIYESISGSKRARNHRNNGVVATGRENLCLLKAENRLELKVKAENRLELKAGIIREQPGEETIPNDPKRS
jgi:hypothetical protein